MLVRGTAREKRKRVFIEADLKKGPATGKKKEKA